MNKPLQPRLHFEAVEAADFDGDALIVDLDGYEGPLHVLLALARGQRVDLLKLSITQLADQYLAFVREARTRRFALAADYLVMAAWLAFLKSRLLLPKADRPEKESQSAEAVAAQLAFRLAKLDAVRRACEALAGQPILRKDVFVRGDPEAVRIVSQRRLEGDLYGLMQAYISQRRRERNYVYAPSPSQCFRLDEARERVRGMLPQLQVWTDLDDIAPDAKPNGPSRVSCVASTFSASLELVKDGYLDARQFKAFDRLYLRARQATT